MATSYTTTIKKLKPQGWSRQTVADGQALNNSFLEPTHQKDLKLAEGLDTTNDRIDTVNTQMTTLRQRVSNVETNVATIGSEVQYYSQEIEQLNSNLQIVSAAEGELATSLGTVTETLTEHKDIVSVDNTTISGDGSTDNPYTVIGGNQKELEFVDSTTVTVHKEEQDNKITYSFSAAGGGGGTSYDYAWIPNVAQNGDISWTWGEYSTAPETRNIKGPSGTNGVDGVNGTSIYLESVIDAENGKQVTLGWGNGETSAFVIPSGEKGEQGKQGETGPQGASGYTPLMRINSTTNYWEVSYDEGTTYTSLDVSATGPQGEQGLQGEQGASGAPGANGEPGEDGFSPVVTLSAITDPQHPNGGTRVTITDKDHPAGQNFDIFNGDDGSGSSDRFDPSTMSGYGTEAAPYGVDTTVIATRAWVGEQDYLTQADLANYATETYVADASAETLSQAKSWVNQQNFATSDDLATRVIIPDSADVSLKDKYLVLRTKADGTVDGWTDFQNQSYSKSEADGRYMRKETDETLEGIGTSADKLRISDSVKGEIKSKSTITSAAGNVFTVSGGAGTEPNKNFVYSGVNYKMNLSEPTYAPQRLAVVTGDAEIISHYSDYTEGIYGTLFFVTSAHV